MFDEFSNQPVSASGAQSLESLPSQVISPALGPQPAGFSTPAMPTPSNSPSPGSQPQIFGSVGSAPATPVFQSMLANVPNIATGSTAQPLTSAPVNSTAPGLPRFKMPIRLAGFYKLIGVFGVTLLLVIGYSALHHKTPSAKSNATQAAQNNPSLTISNQDSSAKQSSLDLNIDTSVSQGRKFTATGQVAIQNESDSTHAFDIQNAAGTSLLNVDTVNNIVTIGNTTAGTTALNVNGDITTSGSVVASQSLKIGDNLICTSSGCVSNQSIANANAIAYTNQGQTFTGDNTFAGQTTFKSISTKAFQIQNASGTDNIFYVDTNNNRIGIGTIPTSPGAALQVAGSIDLSTGAYQIGGTSGTSLNCPSGQLLQQAIIQGGIVVSGSCVAVAGAGIPALQQIYDASTPASFTLSSTNGAVAIQDALSPLSGNLFEVDSHGGSTKYFAVNNLGISVTGNVNTTGQYQINGTQISSANLGDNANLAKLAANQIFSGANTFNNATNNFTGSGSGLTGVNATQLNSQAASYYTDANNISSGTLSDSRLNADVTKAGNTFNSANDLVQLTAGGILPILSGANLTSLNASNIYSGTLNDGRLSSNVALLSTNNTFSANNSFHLGSTALTVQDASTPLGTDLFEVTDATGSTKYLAVSSSGVKIGSYDVCTTAGNCAGVGGGVTTAGGTTNKLAKFTASNGIGNSSISDNGSTVTVAGDLAANNISQNGNSVCDTSGNCVGVSGGGVAGSGTAGKLAVFTGSGFSVGNSILTQASTTVTAAGSLNVTGMYQVNGSQIASANLSDGSNLALLNGGQTFSGVNSFSNVSNTFAGSFSGDGSGLTGLNGTNVASGTVADARLSNNVALLNGTQSFSGANTFTGAVLAKNTTNSAAAFQIQNSLGSTVLLNANTSTGRISIGQSSASYTLDVAGDINTSTGFRVGGSAGAGITCTSGNVIQNPIIIGGIITDGTCVGNGAGVVTTLQDAYNNSGNPALITTTSAAKGIMIKAGSGFDSTSLLQIQDSSGNDLLNADSINEKITVGSFSTPVKFAAKTDYTTGAHPYSVTTADFNGDGKPDLAVANILNGTVSVFLNNGDGTFATKVDYTTGTYPESVTSADFNGDGHPDLAVANQISNTVSVFLNNGDGTFATKVDYTTGSGPHSVTTADFNGDGKPDLAVANSGSTGSSGLSVFLNNGNGTFATKVDYTTGSSPYSVTTGDFNGDGKPDLAVANQISNTVSVFLNTGTGTFATKVDYTTGSSPLSVTSADFNGDGHPDLAVANGGSTTVSVFLNTGTGTFATKVDYTTGSGLVSVTTADFNGDGHPDLAVANSGSDSVSLLLNTGTGTFAAKVDYTTGANPAAINSADFNGDGHPDLAATDYSSGTVSVLLSTDTTRLSVLGDTSIIGSLSVSNLTATDATITGSLKATGNATFQDATNSASAFSVQNATGSNFLNVDSVNSNISLGQLTTGALSSWTTSTNSLPQALSGNASITANGYVYVIGGYSSSTELSTVYYAKLNPDGSNGAWSTDTNPLPQPLGSSASATANGYVYVIGGYSSSTQATVYYAKLNVDGSTGVWQANTNAIPSVRKSAASVIANGYIYVVGGNDGSNAPQSTVYYAKLNVDGSTGAWSTSLNPLTSVRSNLNSISSNGYIYAIGGYDSTGNGQSTVYYAKLNSDGSNGAWSTDTNALPQARTAAASATANGYAYIITGAVSGYPNNASTVYFAKLNADGSTGVWQTNVNVLPQALSGASSVAANGRVYLFGGVNSSGATPQSTVYYATVQGMTRNSGQENIADQLTVGNGLTVAGNTIFQPTADSTADLSVQNASGGSLINVDSTNSIITLDGNSSGALGAWQTASNNIPANRQGQATVTANGYMYVLGGSATSTVYYSKLNANGTPSAWVTSSHPLPINWYYGSSVVANGYVYAIGGHNGSTSQSSIYYAKLNADGSTSAWITAANALPAARSRQSSVVANGYVYVLGGYNGSAQTSVYYAKLNADGSVGAWATSSNPLSVVMNDSSAAVANGFIYMLGGDDGGSTTYNTVYYAKLNADGSTSAWSTTTTMPQVLTSLGAVVSNGYLYAIGGLEDTSGTPVSSAIYYAKLNADGTLNAWQTNANAIPQVLNPPGGVAMVNGYVYVMGLTNLNSMVTYYASTARVQIGANLDLVGLQGGTLSDGGDQSVGSNGGSITAGNGVFVGSLQVQGQGSFAQGLQVGGNLTVGGSAMFQNSSDSVGAFQIQNAAGTSLFVADTSGMAITINGTLSIAGNLTISSGFLITSSTGMYGTTLPASPVNGQEFYYEADAANGVVWHLRYDSSLRSGSGAWAFLGGSPLYIKDTAGGSAGDSAVHNTGATLTLALSGLYNCQYGGKAATSVTGQAAELSLNAQATSVDNLSIQSSTGTWPYSMAGQHQAAITSPSSVVKVQYGGGGGNGSYSQAYLTISPVYVY